MSESVNEMNSPVSESGEEFNVTSFAEEIAAEMFAKEPAAAPEESAPPVQEEPRLGETVKAVPEGQPGVKASEIKPLPKSWKKDMQAYWEKLDPAVHEYVYNREADVLRGLQMYQEGYQRWNKLIEPYQQVFQQHPDVDPVQVMQNLMRTHLTLLSASPEEKRALAQHLLKSYNIDLAPAAGDENTLNHELAALRQELQALKSGFTEQQRRIYEEGLAAQKKQVDAFFADPKNEYAEEVANDILSLIRAGVATDLQSAYERAIWLNPAVREKILAKQAAASQSQSKTTGTKFPNLSSDLPSRPAKTPKKSMDDTIAEIAAKYSGLQ